MTVSPHECEIITQKSENFSFTRCLSIEREPDREGEREFNKGACFECSHQTRFSSDSQSASYSLVYHRYIQSLPSKWQRYNQQQYIWITHKRCHQMHFPFSYLEYFFFFFFFLLFSLCVSLSACLCVLSFVCQFSNYLQVQ